MRSRPRRSDFGDPQKEQQLRDQHRLVLEAIREGKLESVLDRAETDTLAGIKQLDVQWENAASVHNDRNLTMQLRVTEDGAAVPSARLTFRFARPDAAPFYTQAVTDSRGAAQISIEVEESALADASVMVQASHQGRTVTRKFALRKTDNECSAALPAAFCWRRPMSTRGRPPREPALSEAEGPVERSEASSRRMRQYGSQRARAVSPCLG